MPRPSLDPDPREEKLPAWVRKKLEDQRRWISDMEATVDAVKSEHKGSNVRLVDFHSPTLRTTPLPKNSHVEFDSNWGKFTVHHDSDGKIRIQGDNVLLMRLQAGNSFTVELDG